MIVPSGLSPFHTMGDDTIACVKNSFDENMYLYDQQPCSIKEEPTYTSMKPAKCTQVLSALTSQDNETLTTWTNVYPENWTTAHILDWLFYVALLPKHKIDFKKFGAEKFQNLTGKEMCKMNRDQFVERMPEYGHILYEELKLLLREADFEEPDISLQDSGNFEQTFTQINGDNDMWTSSSCCYSKQAVKLVDENSTSAVLEMNRCLPMDILSPSVYTINGCDYDFDPSGLRLPERVVPQPDDGYVTEYSDSDPDSYTNEYPKYYTQPTASYLGWQGQMMQPAGNAAQPQKVKRSPGRPRRYTKTTESSDEDCDMLEAPRPSGHRGRRHGQSSKGNHLWEFVRDLLKNPEHNNKIIKWEDRKAGVFRFVHSDKVAKLWGGKKNNAGMTYEKLSRAMRYYYKRGILERVDGRRLVYKFGKNATGWQED